MYTQTKIGEILHQEHLRTLTALTGLEEMLKRQGPKKPPDLARAETRLLLEGAIKELGSDVDRHFSFEENNLFTILKANGEVGIVMMLGAEHEAIRPLAKALSQAADKALAGDGFDLEAWRDFHELGLELCEREMFHIQKEEMGLLAAISFHIDPETDARLAESYSR